jgi:hypothetical protein
VERRPLMRGSRKILMALVAVVILAAPLAWAGDDLGLPTNKTSSGTISQMVRFDGVIYRITTDVSCDLFFRKIDDGHHLLNIKPVAEELTPYCEASIQWGMFPAVVLGLEAGGTNSWLLGTETGYAEK